jgi:hypothetical protein
MKYILNIFILSSQVNIVRFQCVEHSRKTPHTVDQKNMCCGKTFFSLKEKIESKTKIHNISYSTIRNKYHQSHTKKIEYHINNIMIL